MMLHERPVRFEDVDAAGIVFFARFLAYCHDAMERFFDGVPGGYVDLITHRRVGFPTVHVHVDFTAPLRYGDTARIAVEVLAVGTSSTRFRHTLTRAVDDALVARVEQVVVATDLAALKKVPLPPDCRALLQAHLVP